jgi:hypothetical protein
MSERYYDSSPEDVGEEDYYEEQEEGYKNWERNSSSANKILLFAALGFGLLVLVIFIGWFVFPRDKSAGSKQIKMLEARVRALENKLLRFDKISENLIRLENQTKKFAHAVDRFDQFETSTVLRMDMLAKELNALRDKTFEIKPVEPAAPKTESIKKEKKLGRYHTVQAGETLYSISRRYSLTVDELRRFNELKNDTTIYPGQKLIISASESQ